MNTERTLVNEESPAPRFSQSFWGKDDAGYSALTTRMRHAKVTCQEILSMFQARAALEEEYGKKLVKLSKSPLGKDELGTLRESLDIVRYEVEATGKSHIELASKMRDQLENALEEFNNTQKDTRKLHQASIDRTFRNKQLYMQQLVKAKEKYETECIRTKGLSAAKMNLVGKELDKVTMKMEKTELASRAADVEYQASIRQLTEINDKWIIEWRAACDKFQLLEEQRIDYLRTTLWNYANIISSTCVADDESCERIRSALEQCDVNQNLQSFIEACATGDDVPDIAAILISRNMDGADSITDSSPAASRIQHQPQDAKTRTILGPHQPIPGAAESSAPSSRRQSFYSTNGRSEPEGLSTGNNVEMALTIGNNLFKLDQQTAALLNQADSTATPPAPGGYAAAVTPTRRLSNDAPSPGNNSLGIALDASGTVKENRFPHWRSQAPIQQQQQQQQQQQLQQQQHHTMPGYHMGSAAPGAMYNTHQQHPHPQQQYIPNSTTYPTSNVSLSAHYPRSQTMPLQHDPSRIAQPALDSSQHRRSLSGTPSDPAMVNNQVHHPHPHQHQVHHQHPYQGQSVATAGSQQSSQPQLTHDGRPILFYVRVIFDYEATIPEEINLKEGDILAVLIARDDGWWEGDIVDEYRGHMRGIFPSNFTEPTA
ncbi:Proline-serine-threonine phosphatase-interacting protein 2 [Mortierella polycephala]|uniref:Proline-serine-threonine phosphatase-interacting protein 2 n=1 Tax=Mortierella polycephala TaxID=41804 RepID=A0A9P6UA90_9FUNG|nr:Proline-serine-threonine phosphatase-interacting protein 2 [Mortierella polycephala]